MRIVHLPCYDENPYQNLLMEAQRKLGHDVWEGGGGGNFLGVALREWKADLLHFHWLHPYLLREGTTASVIRATRFLVEVAFLKCTGTRIAWTIHNLVNHDGRHTQIEKLYSRLFVKLADAFFVHSETAGREATKRFSIPSAKLHVIPHGHYRDAYPNTIGRTEARERLGLPEDAIVFLFLGRIEPYKGVFDLIDAFDELPESCHLLIAGRVTDADTLRRLDERNGGHPRIHCFPERVPDAELQVFYNAADAVAFPFRQILTSGSLVLAMSFGRACAAPCLPPVAEALGENGGILFEPEEAGGLAGALRKAADRHLELDRIGAMNRDRVLDWSWERVARITLAAGVMNRP
jgi:glycosyltransferase involved in cell wall biosynthesis